jgi:hypothetical protein
MQINKIGVKEKKQKGYARKTSNVDQQDEAVNSEGAIISKKKKKRNGSGSVSPNHLSPQGG